MKNVYLFFLVASMVSACTSADKKQNDTARSTADTIPNTAAPVKTDSSVTTINSPAPTACQSLIADNKLNKPDTYQESAKPIKITLTLNKDSSQVTTAQNCYFNNSVTVQAVKKSGKPAFKRTLLKDDLVYFVKTDDEIIRSVLMNVVYKPTFNGHKYITLTMQLIDPTTKKKTDYTLFMNFFGEILKVR